MTEQLALFPGDPRDRDALDLVAGQVAILTPEVEALTHRVHVLEQLVMALSQRVNPVAAAPLMQRRIVDDAGVVRTLRAVS